MGGFIRSFAPYAAVLQGQQQGQNASDYARRQMEQQQIADSLNRALLLGKLQDMQAQQKAMTGLPADEQQFLNLGGSIGEYQKRQDMKTQAGALADQMYQGAMDTSKPPEERMSLFQKAAQLRANPDLIGLPEFQKYGTTKPPEKPFKTFSTDAGVQAFEGYDANGNPIVNRIGGNKPSTAESPADKFYNTPIGLLTGKTFLKPDGTPFSDPGMSVRDAIAAGGVELTDKNRDLLGQAKEASSNLDGILEAGKKVLPMGTKPGIGNLIVSPIERSIRMRTDPTYAAYAHSLAGIIPYMRNLAGVGRVNQTEMNLIIDRLQSANTYPALQSAVKEANRIIGNAKNNLVKAGKFDTGAATASTNGDTAIGWSPDGRQVMQRPDGSKYLQ